jgi:hypothetical protein
LVDFATTHHFVVSALDECHVGVAVEEVVLLQEQSVVLLLLIIELSNGLNVALLKVMFLELREH